MKNEEYIRTGTSERYNRDDMSEEYIDMVTNRRMDDCRAIVKYIAIAATAYFITAFIQIGVL